MIDDNPAIHEDFRKILRPKGSGNPFLADSKALLFGDGHTDTSQEQFELGAAFRVRRA